MHKSPPCFGTGGLKNIENLMAVFLIGVRLLGDHEILGVLNRGGGHKNL